MALRFGDSRHRDGRSARRWASGAHTIDDVFAMEPGVATVGAALIAVVGGYTSGWAKPARDVGRLRGTWGAWGNAATLATDQQLSQ